MQRYAIIKNGVVENVIDYETAPLTPISGFTDEYLAVLDNTSNPGWTYENGIFTNPNPPELFVTATPTLTDLQTQLATLTDQINAIVNNP